MPTYTQIYYHIVFSTKGRQPVLTADRRDDLFRYIWGIVKNKGCHLYRMNGTEDHLHILSSLHPTVSLADFIKGIKGSVSRWIRANGVFRGFPGWQDGYGAFTHSEAEIGPLIEYIKGQQDHHRKLSFRDELRNLLLEAGVEFDEKYLL